MKKILLLLILSACFINCNSDRVYDKKGNEIIDTFNNVPVYLHQGKNTRHKASDGYNYGLEWQCVEFVKRYYYDHLNHKMPNTFGHAKSFYNHGLKDGQKNTARNLTQYSNKSKSQPKVNDLVIMGGHTFNKYGHVAIVSKVSDNEVEIVQQNVGRMSRATFKLIHKDGIWEIENDLLLGWLRK
ncbi:CHAP domain-containing protein [Polaribacter sp. R2A056_3_33]|uniref:CHAP domain-containing protein n=1 Tax=Polaribacter sp. R2A056_3_33 TaxID=2745563 RepID=UPI001C4E831C|nr:CHAP domain-containing protein [Polaribacter sp. R2A056_3_33]QXP71257.1 CHAP domain-containing protein [Polaribacter sp. R2A056_3_33]